MEKTSTVAIWAVASVAWLLTAVVEPVVGQATSGVNCTATPNHTLCLAPNSACNPTVTGVDNATQALIITLHNINRQLVAQGGELRGAPGPQPAAGPPVAPNTNNLGNLSWNPILANVAQAWANQCQFATDAYRNIGLQSGASPVYVGQNSYARLDYPTAIPSDNSQALQAYSRLAISTWYNEVQTFDSSTVSAYQYVPQNGKYTQLVWGNTTDVGCGFVQWNYDATRVARILFCDYGPGGNLVGFPVYNTAGSTTG